MRVPDVLQIDHERVEARQHLRRRLARLAVQRVDADLPPRVGRVRGLDHVFLHVRPEAVLRPEQRANRHAGGFSAIDHMPELAVDRRGVADEADRPPAEQLPIEEDV